MAFQSDVPAASKDVVASTSGIANVEIANLLKLILIELRVHSELLNDGLNTNEDTDQMRQDIDVNLNISAV